ncbi:hypothetical protein diail_8194 [Diaporthe ilicicola]|nr:hypothetical protein diail_8194 [Diaporthe ilicicola]
MASLDPVGASRGARKTRNYLARLPPIEEQKAWEADRVEQKGDGVPFTALWPNFEQYLETMRSLAHEPSQAKPGRRLPRYDPGWVRIFIEGISAGLTCGRNQNSEARQRMEKAAAKLAKL